MVDLQRDPDPGLYLWCKKCNHYERNGEKAWEGICPTCGTVTVGTDVVALDGGTIRWQ